MMLLTTKHAMLMKSDFDFCLFFVCVLICLFVLVFFVCLNQSKETLDNFERLSTD